MNQENAPKAEKPTSEPESEQSEVLPPLPDDAQGEELPPLPDDGDLPPVPETMSIPLGAEHSAFADAPIPSKQGKKPIFWMVILSALLAFGALDSWKVSQKVDQIELATRRTDIATEEVKDKTEQLHVRRNQISDYAHQKYKKELELTSLEDGIKHDSDKVNSLIQEIKRYKGEKEILETQINAFNNDNRP